MTKRVDKKTRTIRKLAEVLKQLPAFLDGDPGAHDHAPLLEQIDAALKCAEKYLPEAKQ